MTLASAGRRWAERTYIASDAIGVTAFGAEYALHRHHQEMTFAFAGIHWTDKRTYIANDANGLTAFGVDRVT